MEPADDEAACEDHRFVPQYPGEDVSPTSQRELRGWFSYSLASEPFTVCAMGAFLPIFLEQIARDHGYLFSDGTTPCPPTWKKESSFVAPYASLSGAQDVYIAMAGPPASSEQCFVYFFGAKINTASFAMYVFSISVLFQTLLIITMSGAADHGHFRKTFLLLLAFLGSCATMSFIFVVPDLYQLAPLLAIIANACFGASFVLLNSFLPKLVRYHSSLYGKTSATPTTEVTPTHERIAADRVGARDTTPLLSHPKADDDDERVASDASTRSGNSVSIHLVHGTAERFQPFEGMRSSSKAPQGEFSSSSALEVSTWISSMGIGIGYFSSVTLLLFSILTVMYTGSTTFSLRLVLFGIGLWWFTFTFPAAQGLKPRPGPPLPATNASSSYGAGVHYVIYAWKSLGQTLLRARHLKDVLVFLAAWFLLSDGIATVSGTAVLFAKTQLHMSVAQLAMINVTAMVFGLLGALTWNLMARKSTLPSSKTMILACLCLFELIPLYGLLGFLPPIKKLGMFGLQQPWEMYLLGAVFGVVMSGLSSYCRSVFGELIPPGFEASFYALYAVTDKGSSTFGPAIVGAIIDYCGEIRPAFVFLACLIFLPLPLMALIDIDRGKKDAQALSTELETEIINQE